MVKPMARKPQKKDGTIAQQPAGVQTGSSAVPLTWVKAAYHVHTFAYRDPRSAFSSATGLPVVSPTAVLLGIASTLFNLGRADEAQTFLGIIHACQVAIDPPEGAIFFRAFHQLRRYYSTTKGRTERAGFTNINQGTREHGLFDGLITLFVGVPENFVNSVKLALCNRDHLGTHDSLCSLVGKVEVCSEPEGVIYLPPEEWQARVPPTSGVTILTLSRFKSVPIRPTVGKHWWMAGGADTELVPYLIKGRFTGTSRGKIYHKN
jgi:hypothetical protein